LQRQTSISVWCERIIEGGWLLALMLIPNYFNLLSSRHFEPDKATTLRAIVLVMSAAGIVRVIDLWEQRSHSRSDAQSNAQPSVSLWQRIVSVPLLLSVLIYVGVFIFTTITSVVPWVSWWGSYQRLQGTYTNLSYIGLAVLVATTLRRREQLDRLITVMILSSLVAVGYGLVQHQEMDPLPWRGDVITRVASTMGNSIFVAAYLIMVLPYAIYRLIVSCADAISAPRGTDGASADIGWAFGYMLLVLASLAMVFGALKFGAYVRTADLRYWWVYPGSLIVALGFFIVPTLRLHTQGRPSFAQFLPLFFALGYVLFLMMAYSLGQGPAQREEEFAGRVARDWGVWMGCGLLMAVVAYGLFYMLPSRPETPSRTALVLQSVGMLLVVLFSVYAIILTQSRGPWIGMGIGLFVFFTLTLILIWRRDRAAGLARQRIWFTLLTLEVVLAIAAVAFVVTFNFSNAPFFNELRTMPYIGRLGTLLDTSAGTTGDVRVKIWFGDEHAGGAVQLITMNPLRTVIGWGPESMFVAYNQVYPPSLANIEARGASPDRSHEAYLDELVTKGLLGLISHLFVLVSFFSLASRLIRRIGDWRTQLLLITCISAVTAHIFEGLFGIPIVSSLMMLWLSIALVFVIGVLEGQYSISAPVAVAEAEAQPEQAAAPSAAPAVKPGAKGQGGSSRRSRQSAVARGTQSRASGGRRGRGGDPSLRVLYAIIFVAALWGAWSMNIDNVYADMRFQQGQSYVDASNAGLEQQIVGMNFILQAIRMEPRQDFYYLNLGRTLMNITDIRRQMSDTGIGQPKANPQLSDLLRLQDALAVQTFVLRQSPMELLSYARVVLEYARDLNPMNKDHYANLARMYNFWYTRFDRNIEQLRLSTEWYEKAHAVAPQDVVILNEYAGSFMLQGNDAQSRGDTAAASAAFAEASRLLERSKQLDPNYPDTDSRIAELLRLQGNAEEAVNRYIALIEKNPHALDSQLNGIMDGLRDQPALLLRLRDAYDVALAKTPDDPSLLSFVGTLSMYGGDLERATETYAHQAQLQPDSIEARRNYMLVLSDTKQFAQAASEAEALLQIFNSLQSTPEQISQIEALISYYKLQSINP